MIGKTALALFSAVLLTGAAPQSGTRSADALGWMAGHWEAAHADGSYTEELWMVPRDGMLAGLGRTGDGDSIQMFEVMRIAPGADGTLSFHASPNGEGPFVFALKEMGPSSFTFERSGDEFPQRVSYSRDGNIMTATISGPGDQAISWTYRRKP